MSAADDIGGMRHGSRYAAVFVPRAPAAHAPWLAVPHALALHASWLAACLALATMSSPARAGTAAPAASAKPVVAKAAAAPSSVDPLELLRERLAEKLGAARVPQPAGAGELRVVSKAVATAAEEPRPAPARKPSPAVAVLDAHAATRTAEPAAAKPHGTWSYGGEAGPQAWGGLRPEFSQCASGRRQSPIDIRGGIAVDLDPVVFEYQPSGFAVVDNGHTVQVDIAPGNRIEALGRRYDLVQFHFHRPSEERIDGRQFEMDVHLVHRDPEGRLAVVAVLLERGAAQPVVQAVWNNLPLEKGEAQSARGTLDLAQLLPRDRGYYTYMGSLTTPPCSEGVLWMVMREPVTVSPSQIDIFSRLYPMNARPVQAAGGRLIKQSN